MSSGIDMALRSPAGSPATTSRRRSSSAIEYDPQPPFDAGSPEKAPAEVVELVRAAVAERERRASARVTA